MAIWKPAGRILTACALGSLLLAGGMAVAEARTVVVKRSTVYVSTLPKGCVRTTYSGGVVVWKCGTVFYQPYKNRYVRVYIN